MFEILAKVDMGLEYSCGNINNFVFSGMFPYVVSTIVLLQLFRIHKVTTDTVNMIIFLIIKILQLFQSKDNV